MADDLCRSGQAPKWKRLTKLAFSRFSLEHLYAFLLASAVFRRIEHLEALSPSSMPYAVYASQYLFRSILIVTLQTEGCQQMSMRQLQRWVVYMSTWSIGNWRFRDFTVNGVFPNIYSNISWKTDLLATCYAAYQQSGEAVGPGPFIQEFI